jgi:hypothetical protein
MGCGGATALYETAGDGVHCQVIAMADGKSDGVVQHYLNDDAVSLDGSDFVAAGADGRYANQAVQVLTRLGEATETAYSEVIAKLPGIWTSDHRGDGVTSAAMICWPQKAKEFNKIFPNFIPQLSVAWRLQPVWDPRDVGQDRTDPSTWAYSDNALLHYLHHKLFERGADYDTEIAPALSTWTDAADICDEAVSLKGGGTEPRYRGCVLYQKADDPANVEAELLAAFDGWCSRRQDGALVVYAGAYYAPTVSIGSDEAVSYRLKKFVTDEESVNEIQLQYISAAHDYAQVDCTPWRDEDDISARGVVRSQLFAPQVPSNGQVRRLAKRLAIRRNPAASGTVTTNSRGRGVRGQRFIDLHLEEDGVVFYDGPAEIIRLSRDFATLGVTFDWVAVSSAIDDWIPAAEEGDPAPVGTRVAPADLDDPVISALSAFVETNSTGGSGVRLRIVIDAPDRADLTWFARWRVSGATIWNEAEYSDIDAGASVTLETAFVTADATVEAEVAYVVGDGRASSWSAVETVDTSLDGVAPASPTNLSTAPGAGQATINWRNPGSSNFFGSRVWRVATGGGFGSATDVSGLRVASPLSTDSYLNTGVSAGTYDYYVTAENAAGTRSAPVGPSTVTVT